jgi:hypothetical protein
MAPAGPAFAAQISSRFPVFVFVFDVRIQRHGDVQHCGRRMLLEIFLSLFICTPAH